MSTGGRTQTIHLPTIKVNLSCYAFGKWAEDYLIAAQACPADSKFSPVPYFLYCQALELGLKAFLLLKGISRSELKKKRIMGHNLVNLLSKAKDLRLEEFVVLNPGDESCVAAVSKFYDLDKRLQYFDLEWAGRAFKGLPELPTLADFVTRVVTNAELKALYLNA